MDGGKRRTRKERDSIVSEIIDKLEIPVPVPKLKLSKPVYDNETEELRKLLNDSDLDRVDLVDLVDLVDTDDAL